MRKRVSLLCAILLLPILSGAFAASSAFNYQGKLTDGANNPLTGSYDLTFKLFDALTGGSQVGSSITKNAVLVSGGVFTAELDFGVAAINTGQDRWLEVAVGAQTLSPRVRLGSVHQFVYTPDDVRMISGRVNADGQIVSGSGFSVLCPSAGLYRIVFDSAFSNANYAATAVVGPLGPGQEGSRALVLSTGFESGAFTVKVVDSSATPLHLGFSFTAVGDVVPASGTCSDGVKNGYETDLDCGGAYCAKCGDGKNCMVAADCQSGDCVDGICVSIPTCTDGMMNGNETDVDCGGPTCPKCADGRDCLVGSDCASGVCTVGVCQAPTCNDSVLNGNETDIDCGGVACAPCATGRDCLAGSDCQSGVCSGGYCQ